MYYESHLSKFKQDINIHLIMYVKKKIFSINNTEQSSLKVKQQQNHLHIALSYIRKLTLFVFK